MKFSPKVRFYAKSWVHAAIGGLTGFLIQFLSSPGQHWTWRTFAYAAAGAAAAPVTRAIAARFPWSKSYARTLLVLLKSRFSKKAAIPVAPKA